jgi:hypothetical protein
MKKTHKTKDKLIRDKTVWINKLLQRNEELEEDLARYKIDEAVEFTHSLRVGERNTQLEAENEALRKFASHHYQCDWHNQPPIYPCTCGLDALLAGATPEDTPLSDIPASP